MLSIEPRGLDSGNEELRSVRAGPSVGHGEVVGCLVLEGKVLGCQEIKEMNSTKT